MIDELNEKKNRFNQQYQNITKAQIKEIIEKYLIEPWEGRNNYKIREAPKLITFQPSFIKFDTDVYLTINNKNLKILENGIKNSQWTVHDIMLMTLRYKSHLIGGQQWGIPQDVYDKLYSTSWIRSVRRA
jgi:hypothetical protein